MIMIILVSCFIPSIGKYEIFFTIFKIIYIVFMKLNKNRCHYLGFENFKLLKKLIKID